MTRMSRKVSVDLQYHGDGRVVQIGAFGFSGGPVAPKLADALSFVVHREVQDEDGLLNPVPDEPTVEGDFQVNISASSEGYRELALYLLALAELDSSIDPGFHVHHEGVVSEDGRTRFHIILRKPKETKGDGL